MDKKNISLEVNSDTFQQLTELAKYENLKNKIKYKNEIVLFEEDIILAAINHFLNDVKNFSKIKSVSKNFNTSGKLQNKLNEIRIKQDLKQKDLREITNIDKSNLSLILNNHNQPSMDYFLKLWIALDCPPIEDIFFYK